MVVWIIMVYAQLFSLRQIESGAITFLPNAHDFHISRCEINWETSSGDVQLAVHLFIDDLEEALRRQNINGLKLGTPKEAPGADEAVVKYITQKLVLKTGLLPMRLTFIGKELSDDNMGLWCYFEAPGQKNLKNILVENNLLTEIFPDQKNIIDVTKNGKRQGFVILDGKKKMETFVF